MTDYDDEMLYDSEEDEAVEFQSEEDSEFLVENQYFEAKDASLTDINRGLKLFEQVLKTESCKGIWGFKSLKKIIKSYHFLENHEQVLAHYQRLLNDYSSLLLDNETSVTNLLHFVQNSPKIKEIYKITLNQDKIRNNKKAVLRLELQLAKVLLDSKEYEMLEMKLNDMHDNCRLPDGSEDPAKASQLMEIYALKISMYSALGKLSDLKKLYEMASRIKGICNPRVSGIIYECGAKLHMKERHWQNANSDFFEAFKNYDDAGLRNKSCQCLKYLVLANMLSGSDINPFDEPRARTYQNNEDIQVMLSLVNACQKNDIIKYENILKNNANKWFSNDPFIKKFLSKLTTSMRERAILDKIKPYINISLSSISRDLNIPIDTVEYLLVQIILNKEFAGKIDQITKVLHCPPQDPHKNQIWALNKLAETLKFLQQVVCNKLY